MKSETIDNERSSETSSQSAQVISNKPLSTIDTHSDINDLLSGQILTSFSSVSTIGKSMIGKRKARLKFVNGPLTENTIKGIADYIIAGKAQRIILLTGAGISTSSGIPDFRSPGIGIYQLLEQWGITNPQNVFDIDYFRENPIPFYSICRQYIDILESAKPTLTHYFVKLLQDHNLLLRYYTQNVDGMERKAGVDPRFIVEGHGTLSTVSCIDCHSYYDVNEFKRHVRSETIAYCKICGALVKPDVVFFGERLSDSFFENVENDTKNCDLMIVAGTNLQVYPMNLVVQLIPFDIPRVLINRERISGFRYEDDSSSVSYNDLSCAPSEIKKEESVSLEEIPIDRMTFSEESIDDSQECMELVIYRRDVIWLGNCDEGFQILASLLGWEQELLNYCNH